ncbi:hypothetical protein BJ944DRAFT_250908 [Cunninghamella echinulata]|nr:hypothetical protein BJ944DRAFT_250908 [Cunninghamella echinulata]
MSLYIDYCQGHEDAWKLCTDYRNKPEWNEFIDQCQLMLIICQSSSKLPFSEKINNKRLIRFEDLLIKPVQRICRYQLLIKEIIRHTNQCFSTSSTQSLLVYSFKSMYDIATEIDNQNEIRDSHEKTNRFIQRLESDWRIPKQLVAQLGCLVISGAIEMKYQNQLIPTATTSALFSSLEQENINNNNISSLKSKYYGCFIFNTYIIFIRPKKQNSYEPKHWFPLHLAVLIDNGYETEFILKCQQHIFHCKAACTQEKHIWIKKIQLAQGYQKEHSLSPPKGLVSSLNSDFLTSFASSSRHPSDIHSIYHHQRLEKQSSSSSSFTIHNKLHRSNSAANYHDQHILSRPQHLQPQQQSSLLNKKRKSVLFPLPMSTSSPSILLTNDMNGLKYNKEKEENEENEEEEIEMSLPSLPSTRPTNLSKIKRRHSSLDLLSITKNHLKSQRKNSIRETVDQKLKDVCTKDYLSSRVRHFSAAGQRKSSVYSTSTVSTSTSSPIPSLSLKNIRSSSSPINTPLHQHNNNNNSNNNNQSKSSSLNRFSLPLLHISPTNITFMDDPSFTFTSSPMEFNDQRFNLSPSPSSSIHSSSSPNHYHLSTSYSLPLNIHHNTQDTTTTNILSHHQNSSVDVKNYPKKKRNSLFLSSFQLSSLSSPSKLDNMKSWNLFSKGFKWSHFFKNTK